MQCVCINSHGHMHNLNLLYCRGEEGRSAFEYLMAHGARYNQQQLEEQAKLL